MKKRTIDEFDSKEVYDFSKQASEQIQRDLENSSPSSAGKGGAIPIWGDVLPLYRSVAILAREVEDLKKKQSSLWRFVDWLGRWQIIASLFGLNNRGRPGEPPVRLAGLNDD